MSQETVVAGDGLPALSIKPHTLKKLHFIRRYIYQFSTALKPTGRTTGFRGFEKLNYLDLFSGPGVCIVDGSQEEVSGTPLLALTTDHPFRKNFFIDANHDYISALDERAKRLHVESEVLIKILEGDCNNKVHEVLRAIDKLYSANLAVIDAFGIECKWATIEVLASCKRMDLIIMFPQGMNINRNLKSWAEAESSALDEFFGTTEWRKIYDDAHGQASKCIRPFLDLYQSKLRELGYNSKDNIREVLIRSQGGQKLYYLIAASRHPLGAKFWKQSIQKDEGGQLSFFD